MKKFYLIVNRLKDPNLEVARKIAQILKEHRAACVIQGSDGAPEISDDADCVLVLGGDGTVLRAARDLVGRGIPLLGVNLGTLGYLAEIGANEIEPALLKLLLNEYTLEERMMLFGSVRHENERILSGIALNDIVIARSGKIRVMDFHLRVNGRFLNAYSADGIIVSTPTGSTGYNLSVGGPIVSPEASMLLVTPIAPHTLTSRSVILPDDVSIEVAVGHRAGDDETAEAVFDGDVSVKMECGDSIEIRKSARTVQLVKIDQVSFLEILRRKMSAK